MWYNFRQNNSGGYWKGPAIYVLIEAETSNKANQIAKANGLYFDGRGDCPCCGNRWTKVYGKPDAENLEDVVIYGYGFTERTAAKNNVAIAMIIDKSGDAQKLYSFDTLSNFVTVNKFK